jgi:ATP adenylyltransferase
MPYIKGLSEKHDCFLCHHINDTENDRENLVVWRTPNTIVVMNRFPYNNGHLLIAPKKHIADIDQATDEEMLEMLKVIAACKKLLTSSVNPDGFNAGLNLGRCAGAGLPDHMHFHLVPRWNGDTNFMSTCAETKVISQSMNQLYDIMQKVSQEQNLPGL